MDDLTRPLGGILRVFAGWIAPLLTLSSMFGFALRLVRRTQSPETKIAARAGLTAGLAIWVYIVYRVPPTAVVVGLVPPVSGWMVGAGLIAGSLSLGAGFMWLVERWAQTPAVGLLVLVLASTSTIAAYSYVFASSSREALITVSLFLLVGATLRVMTRPRGTVELFGEGGGPARE